MTKCRFGEGIVAVFEPTRGIARTDGVADPREPAARWRVETLPGTQSGREAKDSDAGRAVACVSFKRLHDHPQALPILVSGPPVDTVLCCAALNRQLIGFFDDQDILPTRDAGLVDHDYRVPFPVRDWKHDASIREFAHVRIVGH